MSSPPSQSTGTDDRLIVRDLAVAFPTRDGVVNAVNSASFTVRSDEVLGLVGETGSGKSVTASAILGLVRWPGKVTSGSIVFEGKELIGSSDGEMNRLRGRSIGLIPQNGRLSLHPMIRIGDQMLAVQRTHRPDFSRESARGHIEDLLRSVGFSEPGRVAEQYPHQLSGGMAQRVLIAVAFLTRPHLLIADEPTTGLDVTVQMRILNLLHEMIARAGTSAIIITHDLGVVAHYADRVAVMHAGQVVETAPVKEFFSNATHPYSIGLLNALPSEKKRAGGIMVRGAPPNLIEYPSGCPYHQRCALATGYCAKVPPLASEISPDHLVRCHYADRAAVSSAYAGPAKPSASTVQRRKFELGGA